MALEELIKVQGRENASMEKVTLTLTFTLEDGKVRDADEIITWGDLYEATRPAPVEVVEEENTESQDPY